MNEVFFSAVEVLLALALLVLTNADVRLKERDFEIPLDRAKLRKQLHNVMSTNRKNFMVGIMTLKQTDS